MHADATWRFDPCCRCSQPDAVDPGYWVQVQLQLHATGAATAFLGQWTLRSRTALYQIEYNKAFMEQASLVLSKVISKYMKPDTTFPPVNMDHEPDKDLKSAWDSMMDALANMIAGVRCLCHPSEFLSNASECLIMSYPTERSQSGQCIVCAGNSDELAKGPRSELVVTANQPLWLPPDNAQQAPAADQHPPPQTLAKQSSQWEGILAGVIMRLNLSPRGSLLLLGIAVML